MAFESKRITRAYTQTIHATPDVIFPLLCPVLEADWLDDWTYTMLFSKSGVAEEGAVFSTPGDDEPDTIWITTKHDPVHHEVDFARVTPGSRATFITIKVWPKDARSSYVDIAYTHTGLSAEGNSFVDGYTEQVFMTMMDEWERSMNHYLETGSKLSLKV